MMADEPEDQLTFKQKLLFYITAFFVLLAIFSLFAFLFLVPFVIEPAFTTIMMEFDENPAFCVTVETLQFKGASNCSWTSCREGCTKEVYECTQIRVNYRPTELNNITIIDYLDAKSNDNNIDFKMQMSLTNNIIRHITRVEGNINSAVYLKEINHKTSSKSTSAQLLSSDVPKMNNFPFRSERAIREYDYVEGDSEQYESKKSPHNDIELIEYSDGSSETDVSNKSEWFYVGAKLFPNVKGCGYPPMLNCTIWARKYRTVGTNFSCYYSRAQPGLVISDLDLEQNMLNLIYATCIPIPSFILSVIYLTFAYFKIYNEDEESVPLDKNAEDIADDDDLAGADDDADVSGGDSDTLVVNGSSKKAPLDTVDQITSNSDLNSFGHQMNVKMADEISHDGGTFLNSGILSG